MRIVVTGAAGFIGSVLTVRAAEDGHEVLALDDLSRGLNNLWLFPPANVVPPDQATFDRIIGVKHDCRAGFGEALAASRSAPFPLSIDAVVHLAAGTGSLDRPYEELVGLNVEMTKRVWQDAKDLGARVFVFPTTSLGTVPSLAESPYVKSKEDAMQWLLAQRGGPTLVPLRFFNVAGAYKGRSEKRQHEVHLLPRLAECYRTGEPLVINGDDYPDTVDGTPGRDFVHVLDVVDTILKYLTWDGWRSGARGDSLPVQRDGAIWLGTGEVTSALQAVRIFGQHVGPIETKVGPRRAFDTGMLRCPVSAVTIMERVLGRPLAPAWVSVRDEAEELLGLRGGHGATVGHRR